MPAKWGGYLVVNNIGPVISPNSTYDGGITPSLLHYGPWREAIESIQPLLDVERPAQFQNFFVNFTNFYDYISNFDEGSPGRRYIINKFIQPSDLGEDFTELVINHIFNPVVQGLSCTLVHLGGKFIIV